MTVMGLGLFGGGATVARFLAGRGARVTVTDLRREAELAPALRSLEGLSVRYVLGEHREEDFSGTELVIANPAVPPASPFLAAARARGVPVSSEIALFLELCPARIAAVTGTQGKSSTCNTLHQLLVAAGQRSHLGGNVGHSLLEECAAMQPEDVVVLELSSYQLEALPPARGERGNAPRVELVAVTNVLADHLERHGTIEGYSAAKRRILELVEDSGGAALLSAECARLSGWRPGRWERIDVWPTHASERGANFAAGRFRLDREDLGRVEDLRLPGTFQRENTLVSLALARRLGASAASLASAVGSLEALPHRMQDLGLHAGHRVIDNGVSTTPDSTISAVLSMQPGFTLLLGGKPKALALEELVGTLRGRVRRVGVFGAAIESFPALLESAGLECFAARRLEDAIAEAFARMPAGEELLFSPACASFDAYLNFRERALAFRAALPA